MPEERTTPARREYSFDECPAAKAAACRQYEYLRSSELIQESVERLRAGETDPQAKAVALLFTPDIFWAFQDNSWPRLPYLDAEEARGAPAPRERHRNLAHLVNPWTHLSSSDAARRIVAVYIPPGQSLPRLKKAFADLLSSDYPELLAKEPVDPEWRLQKRGRGSKIEQARADLTGLGAWRLRKKFGFTVAAAILLMGGSTEDKSGFYRAVRRASQKIRALEEELGQMANRVAL